MYRPIDTQPALGHRAVHATLRRERKDDGVEVGRQRLDKVPVDEQVVLAVARDGRREEVAQLRR